MRFAFVAAAALVGCTNAVTLEIASDRPVPRALDSICVGVAAAKDQFGRDYRLDTRALPQTLRVDGPAATLAWVRGDQGGVPAQLVSAPLDGDTTLDLRACVKGPGAPPSAMGAPVGPAAARLAASEGLGGTVVVAVGATASLIDARGGALVASDLPAPPPGTVTAVISADLDGDCDDDLVIATDGAAPIVWIRNGKSFVPGDSIGMVAAQVAAADVDHDGDTDLVLGHGSTLELWLNDGGAHFTHSTTALDGGGHVSAVSALAMADLDGDGNADLVVGQTGAPLAAWLGGTAAFEYTDGAVPPVTLDVERLLLADANGDFAPDLAVAITGAPMRLLVNRGDGRLEDRTYVTVPSPPTIHAAAFGGWDDGCEPDAVLATDTGTPTLHGQPGGAFTAESSLAPASTDVLMYDIDDDGDLDALFATAQGVQWLAR